MYDSSTVATNDPLSMVFFFLLLAVAAVTIVGWWKLFEKAGEPGWKSIIPFYSMYTYFRITGRNGWSILLLFIPLVNIFIWIRAALEMGERFGKGPVYAVLALWLVPAFGAIDLGFGEAKYSGIKHQ